MKKYCAIIIVLILSIMSVSCSLGKKTEAYKESMNFLKTNPQAIELLGTISDDTSVKSFSVNTTTGISTGEFTIAVKGTKQGATYVTNLQKTFDKWEFKTAQLQTENGTILDLLQKPAVFGVKEDYFSNEKWGTPLQNAEFQSGQIIYYQVVAVGLEKRPDGKCAFVADVKLADSDGNVMAERAGVVTGEEVLENNELPLTFNATIPLEAPSADYIYQVVVKDLVSGKQVISSRKFHWTAVTPVPAEAVQPVAPAQPVQ